MGEEVKLPEMFSTARRTDLGTPVRLVQHISAGARGIQAVDQVGGINVGQRLGGENSHTAGAPEVVHQVSLSSVTAENVDNLGGSAAFR